MLVVLVKNETRLALVHFPFPSPELQKKLRSVQFLPAGRFTSELGRNALGRVVQKAISANPDLKFNRLFILVCSA